MDISAKGFYCDSVHKSVKSGWMIDVNMEEIMKMPLCTKVERRIAAARGLVFLCSI